MSDPGGGTIMNRKLVTRGELIEALEELVDSLANEALFPESPRTQALERAGEILKRVKRSWGAK